MLSFGEAEFGEYTHSTLANLPWDFWILFSQKQDHFAELGENIPSGKN